MILTLRSRTRHPRSSLRERVADSMIARQEDVRREFTPGASG